jgi:hypothetical protein
LCCEVLIFFWVQVSEVSTRSLTLVKWEPQALPLIFLLKCFCLRCQPPALEEGFFTNIHRELRSKKSLEKFGIYMWCAQCRVVQSANPSWQALGFQLEGSQRTKSKKTSYLLMNCVVWCSRCADFRVSTRVCIYMWYWSLCRFSTRGLTVVKWKPKIPLLILLVISVMMPAPRL